MNPPHLKHQKISSNIYDDAYQDFLQEDNFDIIKVSVLSNVTYNFNPVNPNAKPNMVL